MISKDELELAISRLGMPDQQTHKKDLESSVFSVAKHRRPRCNARACFLVTNNYPNFWSVHHPLFLSNHVRSSHPLI